MNTLGNSENAKSSQLVGYVFVLAASFSLNNLQKQIDFFEFI